MRKLRHKEVSWPAKVPGRANSIPMVLTTLPCCPYCSGSFLSLDGLRAPPTFYEFFLLFLVIYFTPPIGSQTWNTQLSWKGNLHSTPRPKDEAGGDVTRRKGPNSGQCSGHLDRQTGALEVPERYEEGVSELALNHRGMGEEKSWWQEQCKR
jgi:hypothetical protein